VRLLLLADTHVPRRARDLPAQVWAEVDRADVVVHAGDWVDVPLLDALSARAARLLACWGNNDGPDLRARLPEVARATLDGVRVAVVHETGGSTGREQRTAAAYGDVDVLVFGHSHIPWDTTAPGGLRLLNPGSPTDRRRQPDCTYMTAEVADGALRDVELHRLPRLGSPA
jgi:putative phosphoesterase